MTYLINILLACAIVFGAATIFDFVVYTVKKAPKSPTFDLNNWRIGFVCIVFVAAYYLINK